MVRSQVLPNFLEQIFGFGERGRIKIFFTHDLLQPARLDQHELGEPVETVIPVVRMRKMEDPVLKNLNSCVKM